MDTSYTYGSNSRERVIFYAPPGFEPPETIDCTREGKPIRFWRLSDRSLDCFKAEGGCGSRDCHRQVLGKCRCGFHRNPTPVAASQAA